MRRAAATASRADPKTDILPSPNDLTTSRPQASMSRRISAKCERIRAVHAASPSAAASRVDPTTSVNITAVRPLGPLEASPRSAASAGRCGA